ncbi:MAG: triose-phosphate isomerase [Candidatus Niyogibacteria bacterium CG10_big_fil_rev_8_21_14_0_10_46_36]|uniref:Triosephosphate isomerase n=1 Tax=Candidatus Niyogibacteria bacterium CG10_big_fil_rev_8_21_14_0_10_46_36 TaxID=1974726 RepID=A0A2H0TCA9_9BACT|nr:MAG: triose-phosphate isomerase [Candidatus Niyogibacteria bacterium CG10_big_fil_rev_8_21_14_0_10_46_36]
MKIIIANWKSNPHTVKKAVRLARDIERGVSRLRRVRTVIAPPTAYLRDVGKALRSSRLGAQNASVKDEGPFTGEVSAPMLSSVGVSYVILGHSERRMHFHETDTEINEKIKRALKSGLSVVLCVGERDRSKERFLQLVKHQILAGLKKVSRGHSKKIIIAYEPIWAIGTGSPVSPEDLYEMTLYIRRILLDLFGKKAAHAMQVLYGGSVSSKNAASFLSVEGVDGLLVGGASLRAQEFIHITKEASTL